ncbi:MAG: iron ABC transporter permease [Raineya sp.]|nr:iron ABC transporter permease [Raineya sp.]
MKYFGLLIILLFGLFLGDLLIGSVAISPLEILKTFAGTQENEIWNQIILAFRLPKALTAILAGVALSVSGLLMQTFFANPLASPSELGISAGASLGVASITLSSGLGWVSLQNLGIGGYGLIAFLAIAGAMSVMFIMLLIGLRVRNNVVLLIVGLMLSSLVVSLIGLWQFMSSPEQIRDFLWWTFGSLGATNYSQIIIMTIIILGIYILILMNAQKFNILLLGEKYAQSMGVNTKKLRWLLIVVVGSLAGITTAFCGPIGFIGIAVPHIARSVFKTQNHWILIPSSAILGAIVLLGCDILSNIIYPNFALPINTITALIGSPLVIWIILKRRNF